MCWLRASAHKCNNFKGSIYMVFDYMDHDMTGLMERKGYKFKPEQARRPRCAVCVDAMLLYPRRSAALCNPPTQTVVATPENCKLRLLVDQAMKLQHTSFKQSVA